MAELSALTSRGSPPGAVGPAQMDCKKRSGRGSDHPQT